MKWKVTLSDGRSFAVTSDQQPSEADVWAALGEQPPAAPESQYHPNEPRTNMVPASTEQFRDPTVPDGMLDYALRLGKSVVGAGANTAMGMIEGFAQPGNVARDMALQALTDGQDPNRAALSPVIGMLSAPGRIASAVNTDNPELAGQEMVEAASLLPLGGRAATPAGFRTAVRNVPADLATVGRVAGPMARRAAPYVGAGAVAAAGGAGPVGTLSAAMGGGVVKQVLDRMFRRAEGEPATPPRDPVAERGAWADDLRARKAIEDQLANEKLAADLARKQQAAAATEALKDQAAKANAARRAAYAQPTKPSQPAPAPGATPGASAAPQGAPAAPAGPAPVPQTAPSQAAPAVSVEPRTVRDIAQANVERYDPGIGALTGDEALREAAAREMRAGRRGNPYEATGTNPVGRRKFDRIKDETGNVPTVLEDIDTMKAERLQLKSLPKKQRTPTVDARIEYLDAAIRLQDKLYTWGQGQ